MYCESLVPGRLQTVTRSAFHFTVTALEGGREICLH